VSGVVVGSVGPILRSMTTGSTTSAPRWRRVTLRWPAVVGGSYLLTTLVVTAAEYVSERSKLSRGFYTDTFSPFAFTHLLTFPVSAIHSDWPGIPSNSMRPGGGTSCRMPFRP
jgi:hypothetical protein